MIYTIMKFKNGEFYIEKKTDEEHIIMGWAIVKITSHGAEYRDSSKVFTKFIDFAEMMNTFENCKVKGDEISEDEEDFEFYEWKDFTKKFYDMTYEIIDGICFNEETAVHLEIEDLEKKIAQLKQKEEFYKDYPKVW